MKTTILFLFMVSTLFIFGGCSEKTENKIDAWKIYEIAESETENWTTYQNDKYGYAFKHPEKFTLIQPLANGYVGGNIIADPDLSYITVYVVPMAPALQRKPDLTIDGYSAVLTPPYGEYRRGITIYKNTTLINIFLTNLNNDYDKNTDGLIRQIISTINLN